MRKAIQIVSACLALLATLFVMSGCGDNRLHDLIGQFDSAVQESNTSIRALYSEANDIKRNLYISELKLKPGASIDLALAYGAGTGGSETALIKYYGDDYVKARLDALDALAAYTAALSALATSSAPQDAQNVITTMGDKVTALSSDIGTLEKKHVDITNYATPIAEIARLITVDVMDCVRDRSLRKNLLKSKTTIKILCKALSDDLDAMNSVNSMMTSGILSRAAIYYNNKLKSAEVTDQNRSKFLDDLGSTAKQLAMLDSSAPSDLVHHLEGVHDKLIDYLSGSKPKDAKGIAASIAFDMTALQSQAQAIKQSAEQQRKTFQSRGVSNE